MCLRHKLNSINSIVFFFLFFWMIERSPVEWVFRFTLLSWSSVWMKSFYGGCDRHLTDQCRFSWVLMQDWTHFESFNRIFKCSLNCSIGTQFGRHIFDLWQPRFHGRNVGWIKTNSNKMKPEAFPYFAHNIYLKWVFLAVEAKKNAAEMGAFERSKKSHSDWHVYGVNLHVPWPGIA